MKKTVIISGISGVLFLLSGHAANAGGITIDAIFGNPQPAYVEEPAPAYVIAPSYDRYNGHRHYARPHREIRRDVRHDDHRR